MNAMFETRVLSDGPEFGSLAQTLRGNKEHLCRRDIYLLINAQGAPEHSASPPPLHPPVDRASGADLRALEASRGLFAGGPWSSR
jgi:hypothetical protein